MKNLGVRTPVRDMSIVIHRGSPRWFVVDGIEYTVGFGGPAWGWSIYSPSGALLADGYLTLAELREDAKRAVRDRPEPDSDR